MEDVACEGAVGGENIPEADENEVLDRVVNRVKIKGGLDINQLRRDGTIFEIDEEAVAVCFFLGGGGSQVWLACCAQRDASLGSLSH